MAHWKIYFWVVVSTALLGAGVTSKAEASGNSIAGHLNNELGDAVRVHFFGPDYINWSRNSPPKQLIPKDRSEKTSLRPTVPHEELGKTLECHEVRPASWHDWRAEVEANPEDRQWLSMYAFWNSPSFMRVQATNRFLFWETWPVKVSIAIIGEDFDIYRIFDRKSKVLRRDIVKGVKKIRGSSYFHEKGILLDDAVVEIKSRELCNGFTIFNLNFRR